MLMIKDIFLCAEIIYKPKLVAKKKQERKKKRKKRIRNNTHLFLHDILHNYDVIIIAYDSFSIV